MNRMFLRIFLSFWVAMVLIVSGTASLNYWIWKEYGPSDVPQVLRDHMLRSVERTVTALEDRGEIVLGRRGRESFRRMGRMIHVFDEQGRSFNPIPLPPHLAPLADLSNQPATTEGADFRIEDILTPRGRKLRVIGVVPIPPRMLSGGRRGTLLRLGVAFGVSALICWLLAWYLVRPVHRLRHAADRLATGDLAGRVSPGGVYRRDELGTLGRDFDRMAGALEAAQAVQQQLLRDVSHELRSPLARLQVALELARETDGSARSRHLDRIEAETARLDMLIGDILTLSRHETEHRPLPREPVDLSAILSAVVADVRFEAQGERRSVEFRAPTEPVILAGDGRLLTHAFENVVRNAVIHTPAESAVRVTLERSANRAGVEVVDGGPGVPEAELGRIFLPFHRVDRARGDSGHGIGLAIASHAVERHGGTISAENRPEGGLAVSIELPLSESQDL